MTVVNGVSTRTPFTGNQVPMDRWDPIAKALLTNYPLPTQPGVRNFVYNPGARTTSDQINPRVDYRFGHHDQSFARYTPLDSPA